MRNALHFTRLGAAEDELSDRALDETLAVAHARLERRLERIRRPLVRVGVIDSRIGRLLAAEGPQGLIALSFMDSHDAGVTLAALRGRFDPVEDAPTAARIAREIDQLLDGDASAVARHPVDLSLVSSDFQRRALTRLRKVLPGSVMTYQSLAAAIGAPSSQRAIGNTMASNPVAIYVPCHRVIRSDGHIGSYGGGVDRKIKLLRSEGFEVDRDQRLPAGAVYGHWQSRIFCRPDCSSVRRAGRKRWIIFRDRQSAQKVGMRACKICRPS